MTTDEQPDARDRVEVFADPDYGVSTGAGLAAVAWALVYAADTIAGALRKPAPAKPSKSVPPAAPGSDQLMCHCGHTRSAHYTGDTTRGFMPCRIGSCPCTDFTEERA